MAHLNQSELLVVVVVALIVATALYLFRLYKRKFIFQEKELIANGLAFTKEVLVKDKQGFLKQKITQKKVRGYYNKKKAIFVLTKFSQELNNENISQKHSTIEKITGKKVVLSRVEKNFFSYRAVFYLESFPEVVGLESLKNELKDGEFFVGINPMGEPEINSSIEDFNWLTTVIGSQGSGKTTALVSQCFTYLNSFKKPIHRLFIVDIKKTDFLPLIDHFKNKIEVQFFNPLDLEDLKLLNQELESYLENNIKFFKLLADENISVRHWHFLPEKYQALRHNPLAIIFDEIPSYLSVVENKVKLGKEATDLEVQAFEEQENRKKLSLILTKLFNTARPTGTAIWLASQTGNVSDLAIPFTNLRNHFLMSKTTGATAQVWGIPQELATRSDLRKGLFIYSSSKSQGLVKTPFIDLGSKKQ